MSFSSFYNIAQQKVKKFFSSNAGRYGLPFFVLVVGGSVGLREFSEIRYKYRTVKTFTREEAKQLGLNMKDERDISLESVYDKIKDKDIDKWENVRIPRPWEPETLNKK